LALARLFALRRHFTTQGQKGQNGFPPGANVKTSGWLQIEDLLKAYATQVMQGYVWINGASSRGQNSFVVYRVINDGSAPGDWAFIASSP
jgi:hypothetical protein